MEHKKTITVNGKTYLIGAVQTVNGIPPDENGDVEIETGEGAVLYTEQELTPEQQAQARANIGAKAEPVPTVVSKNQFDGVFDETGYINAATGEEVSSSSNVRTGFRAVPKGYLDTIYFAQKNATGNATLYLYDADKNYIGYKNLSASATHVSASAAPDARYYRVHTQRSSAEVSSIYVSHIDPGDYADVDYSYKVSTGEEQFAVAPLYGKTIVNFGDSIFGKRRPPNDISTELARLTRATVHNCGFGGCRMAQHSIANFDAFSMYQLADAIAAQNFTVQNTAIESGKTAATEGEGKLPAYFEEALAILKGLDFSKVDIITIAYGTNDFTSNIDLDNSDNAYDTTKFAGALRHSIETLLTAYPHLKIFICSQTYRFWMDASNVFTEDSDTHVNGDNVKLTDFVEKTEEVANAYHLPYINNYDIGMNKFNRSQYFPTTDGTHPLTAGCHLIAAHIAKELF